MEIIATANAVPRGSKGRQTATPASACKERQRSDSEGTEVCDVILDESACCSDGFAVSAQRNEYTCSICLDEVEQLIDKDRNSRFAQPTLSCDVVFEKHDGELCIFSFTHRPLGMVATKPRLPVKVVAIVTGSAAEELGVQNGWIIRGIAGIDVTECSFKEVFDLLVYFSDCLPNKHAQCTGCHAVFHCECLQSWLVKGKDTCPNCRQRTLPLALTRDKPKKSEQNERSSTPVTPRPSLTTQVSQNEQSLTPVTPRPRLTMQVSALLRKCFWAARSAASDYQSRH